jgi:hypothetical protein
MLKLQPFHHPKPHFGLTPRTVPFTDVTPQNWAYDAIETARKEGIFVGYPDGRFVPGSPLLRGEAAAMVNRLLLGLRDGSIQTAPGLKSDVTALEKRISAIEQRLNTDNMPLPPQPLSPLPPPQALITSPQNPFLTALR